MVKNITVGTRGNKKVKITLRRKTHMRHPNGWSIKVYDPETKITTEGYTNRLEQHVALEKAIALAHKIENRNELLNALRTITGDADIRGFCFSQNDAAIRDQIAKGEKVSDAELARHARAKKEYYEIVRPLFKTAFAAFKHFRDKQL